MARRTNSSRVVSTALAVVPVLSEKRSRKEPGPKDRKRWFMFAGKQMPIEEIANIEGVNAITVQGSIDLMKEWRYKNSNENVALKVNELVIGHLEGVSKVFGRGLTAKKSVIVGTTKTGKTKYKDVPDVAMQLKTVASIKDLQELSQPKAPLVQTNQQFNNTNVGGGGGEYRSGMSFESRVRKLREERGLGNEEQIEEISDAEILGETSVEDELSDIGINLEDGDEEPQHESQ